MKRKTNAKKIKNEDLVFAKNLWSIAGILLGLLALAHNQTGFLGQFIYNSTRYLLGIFWFIPFIVLLVCNILYGLKLSKYNNKIIYSTIFVFIGALLITELVTANQEITIKEYITGFFIRSKDIFNGFDYSKGGLIGCCLYSGIYSLVSYWGVIIVASVFILTPIVIILIPNIYDYFSKKEKKPISITSTPVNKKQFKFIKEVKEEPISKNIALKKVSDSNAQVIPTTVNARSSKAYNLPSLSRLDTVSVPKNNSNKRNANEKWSQLATILDNFGLPSKLLGFNIGPSVTQFEISPLGNFNIKKYATIQENIKMGLAVKDIRIEAPISGKQAVGIEIPNCERVPVRLKELLAGVPDEYEHKPLVMALGKDLSGSNIYDLIDKMPHLLIAGATGSGKSVCINSIIMTLLLRTRPDEVKMLLIDPKKVEFTSYLRIPHLICDVINDSSKASNALKTLIKIMEERYDTFQQKEVKNIESYNNANPNEKMYYIVCIIDELADLMLTHGKEVESSIQRLAALARAAGIFLILATQRPSTDVITGTIKANIVSRIAFAVSSAIDSRIIIDQAGAETLFGNGDMLYMPNGVNAPIRIQGVYVSDQEIMNVVNFYVESGYVANHHPYFDISDDENQDNSSNRSMSDDLYDEVEKWVSKQHKMSISILQSQYGIGFPRARKLINMLEQRGIISAEQGSKPRVVIGNQNND